MTQLNNSVNNDHGFIGTGEPYFYPEEGNPFYFGNPVSFKLSSGFDKKERKSRRKRDAGAALDTVIIPKPAEVEFTTDTFQPKTWAMALMGEASRETAEVQTIADEAAKAVFDGYHQLANGDIDESTLVVNKDGAPLDKSAYVLEAEMGLLQITDASAADAGDDLTVNYKTEATSATAIDGARVTSFKGKIVIDGRDELTGRRLKVTIPSVTLAVDGALDWLSEDFNQLTMKGTAAVGKKGEAPYTAKLYD